MPEQYTIQEFAQKIRERRPDLANIPDMTLVGKTLAAAPQLKQFLKTTPEPYQSPLYPGGESSRTPGQVAEDQAAHVLTGISQAVTGIPSTMATLAKMGWKGATGDVSGVAGDAGAVVKGAAHSIADPFVPVIKTAAGYAPSPESPEWADAARGAGAQFGSLALAGAAETPQVRQFVADKTAPVVSKFKNAAEDINSKYFKQPPLTPADVNKWMDVPASAVTRGANPGARLLDEKLLGATKEATKANVDGALASTGQQIEQKLANAPGTIDAQTPVYDAAAKAVKRIGRPRDVTFQQAVDGVVDDIEARYPDLDKLSPKDAHALKVELGDSIRWKGAAFDEPVNQVMVDIYHELNKSLKSNVSGIGDLQSRWGDLKIASRNLADEMAADVVGKGTGPNAPALQPSMAQQLAKMGIKWAAPKIATGTGLAAGYGLYRQLTKP